MTADANSVVGNLINAIENELAVETNLEELRIVLGALDATSLKEACVNIRWIVVFNCLNSQNETHITEGCKVLRLVLPALPNAVILLREDIPGALARCLNHPHVTVKLMALDEIKRLICTDEMGFFLVRTHGKAALMGIFDCMGHEEASVGLRAVQIITTLGRTKVGTGILCRVDIATAALEKTKGSEIHRIRLNEALVEIGASSEDALRQFEILGYFSDLISSVKTDDILANLAVLEVLTPLTETWHGHEFLHRHGITQLLVEMLVTAKDHPLRSLFYPGVVKFFGHLGRDSSKQVARDYPAVFRTIFNMSESTEEVIFITSLEAIGMIAYNRGGKSHMMGETAMSGLMKRVYAAITQVPSNWKERGLKVLGNIIHVEPEDIKTDFAAVVQSWFEEMSPHGFETVSEMARNPFPDVKVPALEVLTELASMKWGQTKIANNQPLLEYLLSPKEEDGEAKAAKLQLLRVLANSDTSPSVFGEELFVKIRDAALETKSNGGQVIVEMMSV